MSESICLPLSDIDHSSRKAQRTTNSKRTIKFQALGFQLLRKGGIRCTIPHLLRSTTQVSGHDFSV